MKSYLTEQNGFKRYRTVAGDEILKVLHGDRVILERKKKMRRYYYLVGSPVQSGASRAKGSPSEVELLMEVDQAHNVRLRRMRDDITR